MISVALLSCNHVKKNVYKIVLIYQFHFNFHSMKRPVLVVVIMIKIFLSGLKYCYRNIFLGSTNNTMPISLWYSQ